MSKDKLKELVAGITKEMVGLHGQLEQMQGAMDLMRMRHSTLAGFVKDIAESLEPSVPNYGPRGDTLKPSSVIGLAKQPIQSPDDRLMNQLKTPPQARTVSGISMALMMTEGHFKEVVDVEENSKMMQVLPEFKAPGMTLDTLVLSSLDPSVFATNDPCAKFAAGMLRPWRDQPQNSSLRRNAMLSHYDTTPTWGAIIAELLAVPSGFYGHKADDSNRTNSVRSTYFVLRSNDAMLAFDINRLVLKEPVLILTRPVEEYDITPYELTGEAFFANIMGGLYTELGMLIHYTALEKAKVLSNDTDPASETAA